MADVNNENQNQTQNQNAGNSDQNNPSAGTKNTENNNGQNNPAPGQEHMIPKSRFDEVNKNYKDIKKQLDELIAKNEEAERTRKEKQGEFEELYNKAKGDVEKFKDESKTLKSRVETLEGVINWLLEAKLKNVPEEMRDLIPENMTPEQKLAWLNNAEAKGLFKKEEKQETPVGEQTNPNNAHQGDITKLNPMQLLLAGYGKK